jgi:hypothetical protein
MAFFTLLDLNGGFLVDISTFLLSTGKKTTSIIISPGRFAPSFQTLMH